MLNFLNLFILCFYFTIFLYYLITKPSIVNIISMIVSFNVMIIYIKQYQNKIK
jgi:hypothetical protein